MKILKDLSLIKYGITGIFITIFHTIIFVFLSNYFSRVLIILILEPSAYALKFTIYFRRESGSGNAVRFHSYSSYFMSATEVTV